MNDKFKDMPGFKVETLSVIFSEDEEIKVNKSIDLTDDNKIRESLIEGEKLFLAFVVENMEPLRLRLNWPKPAPVP